MSSTVADLLHTEDGSFYIFHFIKILCKIKANQQSVSSSRELHCLVKRTLN